MKDLILRSTILLMSLCSFAQSPTNGLVASYPFNGNANDESGNGNNGVVNGATLTVDRFGKTNSAYSFNGSIQYIQSPYIGITGNLSRSISVWFKLDKTNNSQDQWGIVAYGGNGNPGGAFSCNVFPGNNLGVDVSSSYLKYNPVLQTGVWHNFTATYSNIDGNNVTAVKEYLDGALLTEVHGQYSPTAIINTGTETSLLIGRGNKTFVPNQFLGSLDDIKIYNRALTASEVTALYNDDNTGLIAHYPFNGNAKDMSGNGNHGIVNGATLTTDRFGKANSAYDFSNKFSSIIIASISQTNLLKYSVSGWFQKKSSSVNSEGTIFSGSNPCNAPGGLRFCIGANNQANLGVEYQSCSSVWSYSSNKNYADDKWHSFVAIFDGVAGVIKSSQLKVYIDNVLVSDFSTSQGNVNNVIAPINNQNLPTILGNIISSNTVFTDGNDNFQGKLDDIKIYSKVLSSSEITSLYNENKCFETVSVTDTLRISSIAGINSLPESFGSIKVYPNPAHDILNISISKPSTDYNIKIADNTGKTVYTSAMSSNNLQINLSQFTAKGLYLIQILDNTNKVLDVRKLVLE